MVYADLQELLNTARDIVLLGKSGEIYSFAFQPAPEVVKRFYEESISNPDERNLFGYWQFIQKTGQINGSSINHCVRLQVRALNPRELHLPDVLESRTLEKKGKLINNVYRDLGIAVYGDSPKNQDTARTAIEIATQNNWDLPLIVPFRDLDYKVVNLDVKIFPVNNPQRIIHGKEAEKILVHFCRSNEGAVGLSQGRGGYWNAGWGDFQESLLGGLVDWYCGEATRESLEEGYSHLSRKHNLQIEDLTVQL